MSRSAFTFSTIWQLNSTNLLSYWMKSSPLDFCLISSLSKKVSQFWCSTLKLLACGVNITRITNTFEPLFYIIMSHRTIWDFIWVRVVKVRSDMAVRWLVVIFLNRFTFFFFWWNYTCKFVHRFKTKPFWFFFVHNYSKDSFSKRFIVSCLANATSICSNVHFNNTTLHITYGIRINDIKLRCIFVSRCLLGINLLIWVIRFSHPITKTFPNSYLECFAILVIVSRRIFRYVNPCFS